MQLFHIHKQMLPILALSFFLMAGACKESSSSRGASSAPDSLVLSDGRVMALPLISAHRGGKNIPGHPENHLATMKKLHEEYPSMSFEVDVQSSADGTLFLFHDDALDKKTTGYGPVGKKSWDELQDYFLRDERGRGTKYHFSKLEEVLQWADAEEAVLWIDFKRSVAYEDVLYFVLTNDALDNVILISYSLGQAKKLHALAPKAYISVSARNEREWDEVLDSGLPLEKLIAFTGTVLSDEVLFAKIHEKGVTTCLGTLGNLDGKAKARGNHLYGEWREMGVDIFSTDRPLAVAKALKK